MNRALYLALALSAGCAAPRLAQTDKTASAARELETRCYRIGSLATQARYNPRAGILDERSTPGPSRIIWLTRPNTSHILTAEGDIYECDRIL